MHKEVCEVVMDNSVLKNIKIFHQLVINSIGVKDMPKYPSVTTT